MSIFDNKSLPFCIDLDGTLIREDVTLLSAQQLFRKKPEFVLSRGLFWLLRGQAYLKSQIIAFSSLDLSQLTFHQPLLDYILQERKLGRKIVLATAADQVIAQKVADYLGCFDQVIASDGKMNRRAEKKAEALVKAFGYEQFIYAGNSRDDLKVWTSSAAIIAVNCSSYVKRKALEMGKPIKVFSRF